MAAVDDVTIRLQMVADTQQARLVAKEIKKIKDEAAQLKRLQTGIQKKFPNMGRVLKDEVTQGFKQAKYEAKRFKMEYLSIMFGGMMLQRVFGGMLKSLVKNFKDLTKGSVNPLSTSLTRLEANFKFLQFSIMDAAGPWIIKLADAFSSFALWIAKTNPETLSAIAIGITALAGAGTALALVGSATLFYEGLVKLLGKEAGVLSLTSALDALAVVGLTLSTIKLVLDLKTLITKDGAEVDSSTIKSFASVGLFLGWLIGGPLGALIGGTIGSVVGLITITVDAVIETSKLPGAFGRITSAYNEASRNAGWKILAGPIGSYLIFKDAVARLRVKTEIAAGEGETDIEPTIENLQAATLLAQTAPEDLAALKTSVVDLSTAFGGEKGINTPLALTKTLLDNVNTNINTQIDYVDEMYPKLVKDTEERNANASAIQSQADANFNFAASLSAINEARREAAEEGVE